MACENISSEFTLYKLSFSYERKEDFVTGLWSWCQPKCFAVYRLTASILLTAYLIFDIAWSTVFYFSYNPGYWFLYGMNWSFVILVVSYLIVAVISIQYAFYDAIPNSAQMYFFWAFYTVGSTSVCMSTLLYWMSFYGSSNDLFQSTTEICKHSILISFLMFDLSVSSLPIRLCHALYCIIAALVYIMFVIFYSLLNGPTPPPSTVIYPNLKSHSAGSLSLMIFSVIFISILAHTLLYTMYTLRMFIKDMTSDNTNRDTSGSQGSSQLNVPRRSSSSSSNASIKHQSELSSLPKNFKSYSTIEEQ